MAELRPGREDAVAPATLAVLAAAYPGLGPPERILRDALSINSRSCLFQASGGEAPAQDADRTFFAKGVLPARKTLPWLLEEHRVIRHLVQAGYATPRVLVNDRGSTVTPLEGRLWAVHAAARGEDRYGAASVFAPFASWAEAESAGEALARMHLALADFPDPRRRPFAGPAAQCDLLWEADLRAGLERLLAHLPAARAFLYGQPDLEEALVCLDALRRPLLALGPGPEAAGLPLGVIHGDWIKRNLFFRGSAVAAVVDFDLCNAGPLLLDLALAISAAAYPRPVVEGATEPILEHARSLRAGYEAVRPLTGPEGRALVPLIATCRFEYHVSLVGTALAAGDPGQAAEFWAGQVASLRWWLAVLVRGIED